MHFQLSSILYCLHVYKYVHNIVYICIWIVSSSSFFFDNTHECIENNNLVFAVLGSLLLLSLRSKRKNVKMEQNAKRVPEAVAVHSKTNR